jgi:AcrR family transcriptional regulator
VPQTPGNPLTTGVGEAAHERADARRNRQRILRATARLVCGRTIDDVSMDDIASAAGVGVATVYRRFGGRDGLLQALCEGPELDYRNALIAAQGPLGPNVPPRERLIAFGVLSLELLSKIGRFISAKDHESGSWYRHRIYAIQETYVHQLLEELLGNGTRTQYLADALLAPLSPSAFLYHQDVRKTSIQQLADDWSALATAMVGAVKPRRDRPARDSWTP